jgi:UDP-N-acetylglucosamine--N-acetylmuramyl-(pentapeptide) pyrophosphoryl-undecaprenol N-acetylglucosamine transferase
LAVVSALEKRADVLWVGSEGGMERSLVTRAGFEFEGIPAAGLHGVGLGALPGNLVQLARGVRAARRILRRFQPQVLFFTGGFVGVPVALAGWGRPSVLYVPDLEPALAARLIGRGADVLAVSAEIARRYYQPGSRALVTGYPTRPELTAIDKREAQVQLGLDPDVPVVLVFGGSRGARSINRALWSCLPELLEKAQVIHITGELDWDQVEPHQASLTGGQQAAYRVHAYLHDEMPLALRAADLVVSRAGAATLGEYPALQLPAILVPYPHAWRYQKVNAEYLVAHGAALALEDAGLAETLFPTIAALLESPERLAAMGAAAGRLAQTGAARKIAAQIERLGHTETSAHA